ncbi:MAG: ABC transporter substrate-binding protein [Elusimicrobia bacterium]|nr:ABC transporter substrate-binding protein [Elusimicrobiota bacterium]
MGRCCTWELFFKSARLRRAFGFFSAILAGFFYLSGHEAAASPPRPETLVYLHIGDLSSLDPAYPYDAISQSVILNLYETLLTYEGESLTQIVPLLAAEVPSAKNGLISEDGRSYSFPIRRGVRFQDGSPMGPEDVKYSLMRFLLTDRAGGPSSLLLRPILGLDSTRGEDGGIQVRFEDINRAIEVRGDRVVVHLARPFAPFLSLMARWSYVMSRSWSQGHGEWDGKGETWKKYNNPKREDSYSFNHANGTGPFQLESWDRSAKQLVLKRNERYWRRPAKLGRVILKTIDEFSTRRLMLEAGDADLIDLPIPFMELVRAMPGVSVRKGRRLQTDPVLFFTFQINPEANPDIGSGRLDGRGIPPDFFQDEDVRKGFAYSFDYEGFLAEVFQKMAERAVGPIPPGLLESGSDLPFYRLDLDAARRHFRKAWGGRVWKKGFEFTMTYNTGSELREVACQILQRKVQSLNPKFKLHLRGVEWAVFLDKTQSHRMPIFGRGWMADYPDPHNFAFPFLHSQGRYPIAQGYRNPELDLWVEEAVEEKDPQRRGELYRRIQASAYREALQIYTVHPQGVRAMRDWVQGYFDNPIFLGVYFYPLSKRE